MVQGRSCGEASIFMNIALSSARGSSVIGDSHQPHLNGRGRAWLVPVRVLAMLQNRDSGLGPVDGAEFEMMD